MGRDYTIAALTKGLKVVEYLAGGEILEWKTAAEVAAATSLTKNEAFRILVTLEKQGWAEKSDKGWRSGRQGLIRITVYAQEYTANLSASIGIRRV